MRDTEKQLAKYTITYSVEIDPQTDNGALEADFWLRRTLANPDLDLPDHVYWVTTVPKIAEDKPKPTKTKEDVNE